VGGGARVDSKAGENKSEQGIEGDRGRLGAKGRKEAGKQRSNSAKWQDGTMAKWQKSKRAKEQASKR
jgi:hypothetical protein